MKTIEIQVNVTLEGKAIAEFQIPRDISPGIHNAVVVLDESLCQKAFAKKALKLTTYPVAPLNPHDTFRREDIYGNDGR
jgi:hypothetical protein